MFKEKIKDYFAGKGMSSKDVAEKMDANYSLVSRWMNEDKVSKAFLYLLVEHFPDIDLNLLIKEKSAVAYNIDSPINMVHEKDDNIELHLQAIEDHSRKIREIVAQNSHKK